MEDGICELTKIRNCMTYENENKCLKCYPNYSLIEENAVLTCVEVTKKYCQKINSFNYCIKCDNGYFPNLNGECEPVVAILASCKEYLDEERCLKCSS